MSLKQTDGEILNLIPKTGWISPKQVYERIGGSHWVIRKQMEALFEQDLLLREKAVLGKGFIYKRKP